MVRDRQARRSVWHECRQPWPRYAGLLLLAAGLTFPLAVRAIDALTRGPRGSEATYQQQYQFARFLAAAVRARLP